MSFRSRRPPLPQPLSLPRLLSNLNTFGLQSLYLFPFLTTTSALSSEDVLLPSIHPQPPNCPERIPHLTRLVPHKGLARLEPSRLFAPAALPRVDAPDPAEGRVDDNPLLLKRLLKITPLPALIALVHRDGRAPLIRARMRVERMVLRRAIRQRLIRRLAPPAARVRAAGPEPD